MPLTRDEIKTLAEQHYRDQVLHDGTSAGEGSTITDWLFILMLDVADTYWRELQDRQPVPDLDDPSSFRSGFILDVDARDALINGLIENLDDRDEQRRRLP